MGFAYNNCDYLVLGAILERVTGRPYARLVADRIAKPLGLRSLRVARDGAPRGDAAAVGYTTGGKPYPTVNVATFGAAAALTGTARDLAAFDRALAAGKLVGRESRDILWKGDPKLGYEALGVWSFPARLAGCAQPVTLIERRGDVAGIQVRNVIAPDLGRSVAVFVNDDTVQFGEIWQGKGLSYDLLSAAFCLTPQS
ncbi:serine hydrolase [Sphingomonas sp. PAMC 26621]|uniref:serine hydrolase n=1 Tax=Sphingomonas sp. PAMC 26621 TaxID=1112213 RepID=UPI00237869BD|nr:serine hydrolase domain-containing protein [Sphingomonas sp. PAMC 26621]